MQKPKKFVLIRTSRDKLYAISREKWREMQEMGKVYPEYLSEVIAESDSHQELLRFKDLTEET